jgi:hypothetical protein
VRHHPHRAGERPARAQRSGARGIYAAMSLPGPQSEHDVRAGRSPAPEVAHKVVNVRQNDDAGSRAGWVSYVQRSVQLRGPAPASARFTSCRCDFDGAVREGPSRGVAAVAALTSAVSFGTLGSDVGDHVGTSQSCLERMFACADPLAGRRGRGSARGACAASPAKPRRRAGAWRLGLRRCMPARTSPVVGARASGAQALTLL